jgi:hypothetical protein
MGGMSTEPFKFDLLAVYEVIAEAPGPEWATDHAMKELSRQLHTVGAPDAPLEQQLGTLLADHIAMRAAGEEMPTSTTAMVTYHEPAPFGSSGPADVYMASDVRPLLAKRTRERDEAQGMTTWQRERARKAEAERDDANRRAEESWNRAHVFAKERDTAIQRAERAEQGLAELESRHVEPTDEPRLRIRAHVALLDWLAAATGTRDGHDSRIVGAMSGLRARRIEPSADVVDQMCVTYARAAITQGVKDVSPNGIRAVLSALAETGEEAWPSVEDVARAIVSACDPIHAIVGAVSIIDEQRVEAVAVERLFRSRLAPVIGALRTREAELAAGAATAIEAEREACAKVALDIFLGNTEIPRKDAIAWQACAEFINDEIRGRQ